jgi:hypothetical protein
LRVESDVSEELEQVAPARARYSHRPAAQAFSN